MWRTGPLPSRDSKLRFQADFTLVVPLGAPVVPLGAPLKNQNTLIQLFGISHMVIYEFWWYFRRGCSAESGTDEAVPHLWRSIGKASDGSRIKVKIATEPPLNA